MAQAAGREPIPVSIFAAPPQADILTQYQTAGVSRCVFSIKTDSRAETLASLEQLAKLAEAYR